MDRREPPGVRHVPHPHALSGDAAVSPDGSTRTNPAPRLDPLRYGPRRLPAEAHVAGRTRARLRLDLPAPVLSGLDLAPSPAGVASRPAVPRHVVPLQALQPLLAPADQTRPGEPGVEATGGDHALAACALPPPISGQGTRRCGSGTSDFGRSLVSSGEPFE